MASFKAGKKVRSYVGVRATLQDGRLTWMVPKPDGTKRTPRAVYTIDPGENPKHFDRHPEDKPAEVHKRLYVLEGDSLTWVSNLGLAGHEHEQKQDYRSILVHFPSPCVTSPRPGKLITICQSKQSPRETSEWQKAQSRS